MMVDRVMPYFAIVHVFVCMLLMESFHCFMEVVMFYFVFRVFSMTSIIPDMVYEFLSYLLLHCIIHVVHVILLRHL